MRIWLYSTHASQEFDLVRMWAHEGCQITGVFDCYSSQRPKIKGITDPDSMPGKSGRTFMRPAEDGHDAEEWTFLIERDRSLKTENEEFRNVDVYVLMETSDRSLRMEHYAKMNLPVVLQCFGQESEEEDRILVPVLKKYENTHLACYSQIVADRYLDKRVPHNQVHVIRFGVYPEEYPPQGAWIGDLNFCFTAHNSMQYRGDGCSWEIYKAISAGLPFVLGGKDTEKIGGLGELEYMALKWMYARCTCYLSMGTKPAPYTMTPVEAMMSGCPMIFWDNGFGIRDEEWASGFLVSNDIQQVRNYVAMLLDPKYTIDDILKSFVDQKETAQDTAKKIEAFLRDDRTLDPLALSRASRQIAVKYFDAHKIGKQWKKLFDSIK